MLPTELETRLTKSTWTGRVLVVWWLLLTLNPDPDRSHDWYRAVRDVRPWLVAALVVLLIGIWSHGVVWGRPGKSIRLTP